MMWKVFTSSAAALSALFARFVNGFGVLDVDWGFALSLQWVTVINISVVATFQTHLLEDSSRSLPGCL